MPQQSAEDFLSGGAPKTQSASSFLSVEPARKPAAPKKEGYFGEVIRRDVKEPWAQFGKSYMADRQKGGMVPSLETALTGLGAVGSTLGAPWDAAVAKPYAKGLVGAFGAPKERTPSVLEAARGLAGGKGMGAFAPIPQTREQVEERLRDSANMAQMVVSGPGKALPAAETALGKMAKGASAVFHPAGFDDEAKAAAALHRANLGKYGLMADKETYQLSKHAKAMNGLSPQERLDFIDYVENRSQRPLAPDAPASAKMETSARVSPRTARLLDQIGQGQGNTKMKQAADAMGDMAKRYRDRIDYVLGPDDRRTFVKDYYAHIWKQSPEQVEATMAKAVGGKQGSGRNLKKRSIPTISEGIKLGLEPRYDNPVDAMIAYNENMAKFLRTHAIKNDMVERGEKGLAGGARWFMPGKQPEGWVPLDGALTKRVPRGGGGRRGGAAAETVAGAEPAAGALPPPQKTSALAFLEGKEQAGGELVRQPGVLGQGELPPGGAAGPAIEDAAGRLKNVTPEAKAGRADKVRTPQDRAPVYEQLYAPEGAARIYNNYLSKSLGSGQGATGAGYRGARAVSNGLIQLRLGLSAFHAATMGNEAVTSAVAKAIEQASRGKVLSAAKSAAGAAAAPYTQFQRGRRMFKEIVGDVPFEDVPEMNKQLNGLYEKAGGRLGMDRIYSVRGAGSFYNSLHRGTLLDDVKSAAARTYTGPALERAKGVIDLAGNAIQSTAAPLFESYIPALKRGAWADRMQAWLEMNPGATEAQQEAAGRQFLDNIDNRFGELMVDNNFWRRANFEISQLLLLSPSWNLGTIREIGGGLAEIPQSAKGLLTGKGVTPKTAYVAALLATNAVINGSMTYMKTGEMPEGMDWFAYRTGGKNSDGSPERAAIPGYMKDVLASVLGDPKNEVMNKMNPALREAYELYANKDYRGLPIYPEKGVQTAPGDKGLGDYLLEQNMPISVQSFSGGMPQGSNITPAEQALSIRPSPRYVQNPEAVETMERKMGQKDWNRKRRADARAAAKRKPAPAAKQSAEDFLK